ncbi:MAG: BMP family ABC transporter substrate-binding protein [Clostridia bacterium]|nr:BMP family ABC transporter substrate-binding protein [Clostridia bacterium]
MKKIIAMLMVLAMVFAFAACSGKSENSGADAIADEMTSEDGKYEIAFVTDVGQLKDKSFNQGTWDGCKLYASANNKSYKYYQPANADKATDDDRYNAMKAAVDGGAKVVVCAGFMQETALKKAAAEFTDVNFIFIDGYPVGLDNVAGIAFQEEQAGYLAGYAVVMEGYTKLGFCGGGGGTNPACCRYGYGFVQGANDAAKAKGITVDVKYSWQYGAAFSASPELQTMASGWYASGTEIIFACGGSMFSSIAAAAAENDAKVVGVDVDQSPESATVVTSAMKGLSASVEWALAKHYDGKFADIGGKGTSLGAKDNAVGLPTATWSLKNWTVEQYNELFNNMKNGTLVVDPNYPADNVFTFENANVEVI